MKLKLDMVYRDLPAEDAQTRFTELTLAPDVAPLAPVGGPDVAPVAPVAPVEVAAPDKVKKSTRRKVKAIVIA
jgi:hypothetical protein